MDNYSIITRPFLGTKFSKEHQDSWKFEEKNFNTDESLIILQRMIFSAYDSIYKIHIWWMRQLHKCRVKNCNEILKLEKAVGVGVMSSVELE